MLKIFQANWKPLLVVLLVLLAASFPLAWISNGLRDMVGWPSVAITGAVSLLIVFVGWKLLAVEQPPVWLGRLTAITVALHLIAAIAWLMLLPRFGHGTQAEREGYVMGDAYARDNVAWRLARSTDPLWTAFVDNRKVDQYGGLLFISSAIYRYLGAGFHQRILILLLAAAFSALAVPYTWAFANLAWGAAEARLAAWIMVIYPEVILLGSSQMREAFTVTFVIAAFYGLLRYQRDRNWKGLAWIVGPLLLCLPFTPPAATMILIGVVVLGLAMSLTRRKSMISSRALWIGLGALIVAVLAGLYLGLRQFVPAHIVNPIEMLSWWLTKSAQLQAYMSEHTSGWMQKVFNDYPGWMQFPVLLVYGLVQPFLPAALIARSEAGVWYGLAIWRSLGWTFMLAFLIYAPLLAFQKRDTRAFNLTLCLIVWVVAIVASFRGGGDLWDNPRYRVMFAGLQACLVAWAIIEHRRSADPGMRRALVVTGMVFLWFVPWYLRRYTLIVWPVVDLFKTLGMGLASATLLLLADWARSLPPLEAETPPDVEAAPSLAADESLPPAEATPPSIAP